MTTTRLLIARHGNTFTPDQTPTRVGRRTDLPLVPSGQEQARRLALYLKEHNLIPDHIVTSVLKRTIEMGTLIEEILEISIPSETSAIFNEIDYGPDENKSEDDVIARIGTSAIKDWNEKAIVPQGWDVHPQKIIQDWIGFGQECTTKRVGETTLVITSNGIARFAPYLTGDFDGFTLGGHPLKISTGALCILEKTEGNSVWRIADWNIRP